MNWMYFTASMWNVQTLLVYSRRRSIPDRSRGPSSGLVITYVARKEQTLKALEGRGTKLFAVERRTNQSIIILHQPQGKREVALKERSA